MGASGSFLLLLRKRWVVKGVFNLHGKSIALN
jgi:hypothetical protein